MRLPFVVFLFMLHLCSGSVHAEQGCIYTTSNGERRVVSSIRQVPNQMRSTAQCGEIATQESQHLAAPGEMELAGISSRETLTTSLGPVELNYPRDIKKLFGRNPRRAVIGAASSVSRALKGASFPTELRLLDIEWSVVFLDEHLSDKPIPSYLVSNCHPAWMTPPGNIYVVGQRVVAGCSEKNKVKVGKVADSELEKILLHEMGHAIEAQLLQGKGRYEKTRAEGFATWFEQYAARFSSLVNQNELNAYHAKLVKEASKNAGGKSSFKGTAQDYVRASLMFGAIVDRRGVRGLVRIYEDYTQSGDFFLQSVQRVTGWSAKKILQEELRRLDQLGS